MPKLLYLIMVLCIAVFGFKLADVYNRGQSIWQVFLGSTSFAEEKKEEPKKEDKNEDPKKTDAHEKKGDAKEPKVSSEPPSDLPENRPPEFSESEVDVLQRLSERRKKLLEWEEELRLRENVLNITQTKIDQKINELRNLKKNVEELLLAYNKAEIEKTKRMVALYEGMKPKNAAEILSDMTVNDLLEFLPNMAEKKLALILANMEPKKASLLTSELINYRKLSDNQAAAINNMKKEEPAPVRAP